MASAYVEATSTLKNDGFESKFEYYLDIYLVSDDEDFALGTTYLTFSFNSAVLSSPQLLMENPTFHDNANYDPMALAFPVADQVQLQITPSAGSTGTNLPSTEIRLARITFIVADPAYLTETAEIEWIDDAHTSTFVQDINGTTILLSLMEDLDGNTSLVCASGPTLSGTPVTSIVAGDSYSFTPTVTNGCGTLAFSIINQPSWASFDTSTGALTGTPTLSDVGTASDIIISVADENTLSDDLPAFDITVTSSCTAPSITGTPDATIASGSAYSFTPTVSNGCAPLFFSITNQPAWSGFDTATGVLSGTPTAADVGTYSNIVITVEDDQNDTDDLAFEIEVTDSSSGGGGGGGGGGGCFISTVMD
jgi:hypothetical protein